jgi:outer membrane receptor protein involved in Fe transport
VAALVAASGFVCSAVPGAARAGEARAEGPAEGGSEAATGSDADTPSSPPRSPKSARLRVDVTELRAPPAPADAVQADPRSVQVIDLAAAPPSATLADVLAEVAGVHVRRLGGPGDPAFVSLRGSTAQQVEVLVDGVPLNAWGSSAVDLSELPVAAWDSAEVWRGSAPPELLASPMGGVVQLRSRPGGSTPPRLEAGFGSWSTRWLRARGGSAWRTGTAVSDARLAVGLSGSRSDFEYFDDNGTASNLLDDRVRRRANNSHDQLDAHAQLRLAAGPLTLQLSDVLLWRDGGEPGPGHGRTEKARFAVLQDLVHGRAELRAGSRVRLSGDISWRGRRERFSDPLGEVGIGTQDRRDRWQEWLGSLAARIEPLPWLALLPALRGGIDLYDPDEILRDPGAGSANPETAESPRRRRSGTASLAASLGPWGGRLLLAPSLALHTVGPKTALLPQLAAAVHPWPQLTLRAQAGRGFRPPSFLELYGDHGAFRGNPELRPESRDGVDASFRIRPDSTANLDASIEVGWFWAEARDAITWRALAGDVAVPVNVGKARLAGIEAQGAVRIFGQLSLRGALTWTRSRIAESDYTAHLGHALPQVPAIEVDAAVAWERAPFVRVEYGIHAAAGAYESRSNLFPQAPLAVHSLLLRVQPHRRAPSISCEINNFLDARTAVRFRNPLSPDEDDRVVVPLEDFRGNPLPGRSFLLGLAWTPHGGPDVS